MIKLHFTTEGDGPPVLLIHGMAASLQDWRRLSPALAAAGYRAYAVDLLGHGESAKPADPRFYHSRSIYAALESWIDGLGLDQRPILIGHSLGGHLSLRYALRHPERVRGLGLIGPFYTPRQLSPLLRLLQRRPALGARALDAASEELFRKLLGWDPLRGRRLAADERRRIAADLKRASPNIVYIPRTVPDLTPELPGVRSPALVIWGDQDLTLNPRSFPSLVSAIPGARGQRMAGCGHQPHLGQPEAVNPMILNFLHRLVQ